MSAESEGSESRTTSPSGDKVASFRIVPNCTVESNKFHVDSKDFLCIMKQQKNTRFSCGQVDQNQLM